MTKKIIPFEINLKSSQRAGFTFQPRPQILTNDANAAELNFIITDANSGELTGATATVLLFMKDGSFFQNTDVTRVNNTFVYTIKPNQAKHKGVAQAQLVVKQGTVENASPLMEFEIIGGLETKPIVERDIQDWTSLTAEAKAFVDQIEGFTLESFVENKMGQELANLEASYATRLTGLEQKDNQITAQLAQTDGRIDNLISLPDGSTTNDARLEDIKIGHDGVVYDSPANAVRKQIKKIDTELVSLSDDLSYKYSEENTSIVSDTYNSGYWWGGAEHASSTYIYTPTKINVKKGDVITSTAHGIPQPIRFIQAYQGEVINESASLSSDVTAYTVPDNVDGIIVTLYSINQAVKVIHKKSIKTKRAIKIEKKKFCFSDKVAILAANSDLIAAKRIDNKKNCSYLFNGFFTTFGILKIGHGKTEYGAVYLTIDSTNIKTYSHTGSVFQTLPHGLTLQDYIHVNIKVADTATARATVVIRTNAGDSTTENVIFFGCNGDIYASSTTAMTDAKLQYVVPDMKKDVFIFGDSYATLSDNARWPHHLLTAGYTNMMINGFGGATSDNALVTFKNIMSVQRPKYVVWTLGMNDADTTAINASWKNTVDFVIDYCQKANVELILATVPNTPNVINVHKNVYVRNSGLRYVDFAKAVNGETQGAPWYAGMLSTDNVHPAEKGAKALASRLLIDVPEIIG